nr:hypothetical protein [uncultured Actinoplanes sp.]
MSDSAHRAPADQRRRQAIMWTVVGVIVVIALVLLAFCAGTGGDPQSQVTPPGRATTSAAPSTGQGGQPVASPGSRQPGSQAVTSSPGTTTGGRPGAPASVSSKAPATSSPTASRTRTRSPSPTPVAPRGGADTGGGSSLTGESTIFIGLGVVTLLAAMAAAVLATRPRRRVQP